MARRILVVEDDAQNRKLFHDLLEINGHSVLEASNGSEGVRVAQEARPDLILMDVRMPVMDGIEAARTLRGDPAFAETPIVAVTASAMAGDEAEILGSGFSDCMTKPIGVRDFLKKLDNWLEKPL